MPLNCKYIWRSIARIRECRALRDALAGGPIERHAMIRYGEPEESSAGSYAYSVRVPAIRSARDYTARVIPCNPEAIVPLEVPEIRWQW